MTVEISNQDCTGSQRIHQMFEQPALWLEHNLSTYQARLQTPITTTPSENLCKLKEEQTLRWQRKLGFDPAEVNTTIMIPVFNEERMLPSALGALMMSDIPDTANIHFLFVLNKCSDQGISRQILEQFLRDTGEKVFKKPHGIITADKNLDPNETTTQKNNFSFTILETQTPGKANALNIGNDYALSCGHKYALSFDANNWVDHDTILEMVASISKHIKDGDNTVLVGARPIIEIKPSGNYIEDRIMRSINPKGGIPLKQSSFDVFGGGMAWNTHWFKENGGDPPVATDDYALGLVARLDGKSIDHNGTIWTYTPNTIREKLKESARHLRGFMQTENYVREHFPDRIEEGVRLLRSEREQTHSLRGRLHVLKWYILKDPSHTPRHLVRFIATEYIRKEALKQYKKNPTDPTWEPLSTK